MPARQHAQLVAGVVAGVLLAGVLVADVLGVLLDDEFDVELDEEEEVVVDEDVGDVVDELLVSDVVGSGRARTNVTFRLTAGAPVAFFTVSV